MFPTMISIHYANDVHITLDKNFWRMGQEQCRRFLGFCFHPIMDGQSFSEGLEIHLRYERVLDRAATYDDDDSQNLCRVAQWVAGAIGQCKSKSLCTFRISISYPDRYRVRRRRNLGRLRIMGPNCVPCTGPKLLLQKVEETVGRHSITLGNWGDQPRKHLSENDRSHITSHTIYAPPMLG
jgi:hypothetical protein